MLPDNVEPYLSYPLAPVHFPPAQKNITLPIISDEEGTPVADNPSATESSEHEDPDQPFEDVTPAYLSDGSSESNTPLPPDASSEADASVQTEVPATVDASVQTEPPKYSMTLPAEPSEFHLFIVENPASHP